MLLGELLHLDGRVTADGETMLNLGEQVDLVRLADFLEDLFGPVALLRREDGIGLGGRDGQRARNGREFILFDERRVSNVADVDTILVVSYDVLVTNLLVCAVTFRLSSG